MIRVITINVSNVNLISVPVELNSGFHAVVGVYPNGDYDVITTTGIENLPNPLGVANYSEIKFSTAVSDVYTVHFREIQMPNLSATGYITSGSTTFYNPTLPQWTHTITSSDGKIIPNDICPREPGATRIIENANFIELHNGESIFYKNDRYVTDIDSFSEDKETLGWPIIKMTEFQGDVLWNDIVYNKDNWSEHLIGGYSISGLLLPKDEDTTIINNSSSQILVDEHAIAPGKSAVLHNASHIIFMDTSADWFDNFQLITLKKNFVQAKINKYPNNDLVLFWDAGEYLVNSDLLLDNRKIYLSGNNKTIFNITNQDIAFNFKNNAQLTIDGFTIQGNHVINLQRQEGDLSNNYIKIRNSTITLDNYFYINSLCPELKYVKHTKGQLRIYECYDIKISQCVLQSCDIQECYKANIKNNLLKSYFSFSEIYSIKETGVFTNNIIEGVFYIVNSLNKTLFIKNFFLNNGRPGDDKTSNIFRKNINYYYNT